MSFNNRITEMLEKVLSEIENKEISTTSLLYRCQHIANLLGLTKDEREWIELELTGYPPQNLETLASSEKRKGGAPHYRVVKIPAEFQSYKYTMRTRGVFPTQTEMVFIVTEPCDYLETSTQSLILTDEITFTDEKSISSRFRGGDSADIQLYTGSLHPSKMKGIVAAIRSRVLFFVSSHLSAFQIETAMKGSIERMRNRLASRLSDIDPSLLQILQEAYTRLEGDEDHLLEKSSVESLRTIMRRFSQTLFKVIFTEEKPPKDSEISKKIERILEWASERIVRDAESSKKKRVRRISTGLQNQSSLLSELISRPIHKDTDDWIIGTADRLLLWTTIWIDEMLSFVEEAGCSSRTVN